MPTIADVALQAGVSEGTVSNVFGGRVPVREATRRRVLEAARRLDYQPNGPARALRTGRSRTIGFCVSHVFHPTVGAVVHGASRRAHAAGYTIAVAAIEFDAELERAHIGELLRQRVAAVMTYAANDNGEPYYELQRAHIPLVFVQSRPLGVVADLVMPDHHAGTLAAARYLVGSGHRRIAFIMSGDSARGNNVERLRGYEEAHAEANLPIVPDLIRAGPVTGDEAYAAMADLWQWQPDAVLCGGALLTLGVLNLLRDRSVSVPETVAVAGTGDRGWVRQLRLPVPMVEIDGAALGAAAVEAVLRRIEPSGNRIPARDVLVPVRFLADHSLIAPLHASPGP